MSLLNFCLGDIELPPTIVDVDDGSFTYSILFSKPVRDGHHKVVTVNLRNLLANQMQIPTPIIKWDSEDQARALTLNRSS